MSFNWLIYKELNPDLKSAGLKTKGDFERHFLVHGKGEKRNWNVYNLYPNFNPYTYKKNYEDLSNLNNINDLELHWILHGRNEGREYTCSKTFSSPIDMIDRILYINLDHRKDRYNEIEKQFINANIPKSKVSRISAIYNKRGGIGCTASHIKCLKYAISNNLSNVLILEDDFNFIEDVDIINESINKILEFDNDWDVIFFSGNVYNSLQFNDTFSKAINVQCASGYLVNARYYLKLLNNFEESYKLFSINDTPHLYALDIYWKILQPIDKWYIFNKKLGYQRESYSDIEKMIVNYNC